MSDEASEEKGFKIVDRRGEETDAPSPQPADEPPGPADLPGIDFASFSLSLATSALYHMGLVADPETGKPSEPNLPVARQTIDTLEMLQSKTQGNLTEEEQGLLVNLLTELRMRFVEAAK
ncbi:MAG: DUF1844 domain-containing protein [bacterium]|nr:DUF1844 domain-containing protein [bacterium]MCP5068751.1 DUF1844 domain-containing protein [bacterium]